MKLTGKQLVDLKNRIVKHFGESNWRELGVLTNSLEMIEGHHRLLRSLSWNDPDYEGHVLSVLKDIIQADPDNLPIILDHVSRCCPDGGEYVSSQDATGRRIMFSPSAFQVPECSVDYRLVSVMMPFDAGFSTVYQAIKDAASDAGLTCKRADDIWDDSTVIQDVFSLIFESHIVVCDLSGRNANVFYETGVAHALGKHVIPITQSADDIPFDLRHHRFLKYLNNKEGRENLREQLAERMATLAGKKPMGL